MSRGVVGLDALVRPNAQPKILCVTACPAHGQGFVEYGHSKGWHVAAAPSGKMALELASNNGFDVVVTAQYLPDIAGTKFLKILRSRTDTNASTPALLYGGNICELAPQRLLDLGIWGIDEEPMLLSTFGIFVERLLQNTGMRRQADCAIR